LRAYADVDFNQLKTRSNSDVDAATPYLEQIVTLEADQAALDAYNKMLKNLIKPRSTADEIKDMQQFVTDSKSEFSTLVCGDIAKKLAAKPGDATLTALKNNQACSK